MCRADCFLLKLEVALTSFYNGAIKGGRAGGLHRGDKKSRQRDGENLPLSPSPRSPFLLNQMFHTDRSRLLFPPPSLLFYFLSLHPSPPTLLLLPLLLLPPLFFTSHSSSPAPRHPPPALSFSLLSGALRMQFPWQPLDPCLSATHAIH